MAKSLLQKQNLEFQVLELNKHADGTAIQNHLHKISGQSTVPSVWINGKFVGGCDDLHSLYRSGELAKQTKL